MTTRPRYLAVRRSAWQELLAKQILRQQLSGSQLSGSQPRRRRRRGRGRACPQCAEERARRRREHAAEVRAQKKHKKEQTLHEAHTDMCELMNVLLAADGCKTIDEDEMDAFEGWLHEERKQLQAGAEVNLA